VIGKKEKRDSDWYKLVRSYTLRLVSIRSVSPSESENLVAQEVLNLLCDGDLDKIYTAYGLDRIEGDLYQRKNAYAFLRGKSANTLVLLGHIDTVDTKDYGTLEALALDPEQLTLQQASLQREEHVPTDDEDWLFGRGVVDMKGGVAVNIALMRRLAEQAGKETLPISVVVLATPDEENESAGVLQAVRFLQRLREQHQLEYIGAINTDYTTALYPGDPHHYVYTGTIGKLLPSFLCIGRASHVGDPFKGIDANLLMAELILSMSMNDDLCDTVRGQITSPPVTLHATDLKTHYDVQLPFAAYFYLNVLTFSTDPKSLLERLQQRAQHILSTLLASLDETERRWRTASSMDNTLQPVQPRAGVVLTYAELYHETVQTLGQERVEAELRDEWERWPVTLDKRERCLHLVYRLWNLSGKQGPAVILHYALPYYPHAAATPCALQDAITTVIHAHPEAQLVLREYYPYLSDISYLRLDPGGDITTLKANMPVWEERTSSVPQHPGSYYLPLEAIQQLNIPVANFGPHGRGAHQHDESVEMVYSFGVLPQLLYETIEHLAHNL
jgi:arginine utilization protein RocB